MKHFAKHIKTRVQRIVARSRRLWHYFTEGVWSDTRNTWRINTVKTLSLSMKSFLNSDLQGQACAMAFRTMLAIVPSLALLFAIGRGFGFQNMLEDELFTLFPGQREGITESIGFVDRYLSQTSEGLFVGIGLIFLLWTLISLVSNVERTFNFIWGVKTGRSLWRKISDYTAMLLILPVLMICASGLTIFVSNTLQETFHFAFMTPLISGMLTFASWVFTWIFFGAVYALIPNVKVRIKNAFIAGFFAGTGFIILEWVFVNGQIYVTRYNAIYGSFAFVPLMLIWLQLTWVITLAGAVLCYSSQNIFQFSFQSEIASISVSYREKVSLAILAIIARSFVEGREPPTRSSIVRIYGIPARLVADTTDRLIEAGLVSRVVVDQRDEIYGYAPAIEPSTITVDMARDRLVNLGFDNFIPNFDTTFKGINDIMNRIEDEIKSEAGTTLLSDIEIKKS